LANAAIDLGRSQASSDFRRRWDYGKPTASGCFARTLAVRRLSRRDRSLLSIRLTANGGPLLTDYCAARLK
jgi:hypothetical protein